MNAVYQRFLRTYNNELYGIFQRECCDPFKIID